MADGKDIRFSSFLNGRMKYGKVETVEKFYVANELDFNGLIGINCIKRIGLHLGTDGGYVLSLQNPIAVGFHHVFDKPLSKACLKEMKPLQIVQLKNGTEPVQCKVKAISRKDKEFADKKIAELMKEGVIRPSNSPWRSQPLVVPKDNGSGKRLVINYKPLNDVTEFDAFPLPDVNALFQDIGDAKIFSKIDFLQFYHQLPLIPEDIPKTAFYYDGELYEYTRCPFGLRNAVAYCFRIMKKVLEGCKGVVIYMDDLCVTGSTQEEHDRNLTAVLKAIERHGLSLNSSKCQFSKTETSFLGFRFKDQTRFPDPDRYNALRDFRLPTDAKTLQRFIGMVGFFSNFIPNYSDLIAPLYSKLKKFEPWTDEEISCFESLKTSVFNSALFIPSQHEPLILYTDASDIAISGVLVNAAGRPIQFCSRKLTDTESHYDIVEREALAIYWSINRCRTFLLGRQFVVFCDHKGLQYIFGNPNATPKVIRWKLNLSEYNFELRYYRGSENLAADCFSRVNFVDETPLVLDLEEIKMRHKTCPETKAFLKAQQKNYKKRPKAVTPGLWSCRKDVTHEGDLLKINGKIFVPRSLRYKCLVLAHGCHVGQDGTYDRLRETFFWPKMKDSVKSFVEKCRICSLTKPQFKNPPMTPILSHAPFDCLAADYIGPLPLSQGFKYCLTVIDTYSRYPFVFPVKSLEADVLCECFKKIFALCGYPDAILSDRGTNFESQQFQNFCKERGIRKLRTSSYNPKGNSICERFNKTFKAKIFQVLTSRCLNKSSWTSCIDLVLHDYRFSVHSTTSFRPVDLFFSFKCRGLLPFLSSRNTFSAAEQMQRSRLRGKKFYDSQKATAARFFKKGENVLLRNPMSRTFEPKVVIVQVVKDLSPEVVKVRFPNGRIDQVNKSRVSKFVDEKHKEGNSGSADIFYPQFEPCRATTSQKEPETKETRNNGQEGDEPERRREGNYEVEPEPRRSRRVRFQTLPFDASDPRDPQLLKWGKVVTP
jgi:transposase InsO family protein